MKIQNVFKCVQYGSLKMCVHRVVRVLLAMRPLFLDYSPDA